MKVRSVKDTVSFCAYVGKVCLRLKNSHTIDFAILEAIIKDSIAWNESKKTNAKS